MNSIPPSALEVSSSPESGPISLRYRLALYLEGGNRVAIVIDLGITALVLVSLGIFITETYPISSQWRTGLNHLNNGILWFFAIEYLLRFWVAEHKWRYFFSLYSLIDLMTILPFLVGVVDISFIRIFRWFRILRLLRFVQGQALLGRFSASDSVIFVRILFTLVAIVFVYAGLIYQVEHEINPQNFRTFLDAFYFAVATMTTVGFGDVVPVSDGGRLLTVMMIFTGIALIPWQLGDLIRQFIKASNQVSSQCPGCGLALHDTDAQHCKICGSSLRQFCPISPARPVE